MSLNIAIIDSGINPNHPHVGKVEKGISFVVSPDGRVASKKDFSDEIGHGTAIAGLIREKAPDAGIVAVKIFQKELIATGSVLIAALKWAVEKNMNIIHMSLGVKRETHRAELERLCQKAFDRNTIIVASARFLEDRIFPSIFSSVIGVCWDKTCGENDIVYYPGEKINFGAHGYPRPLPGLPQHLNFHGASFAAARITARIAEILEHRPETRFEKIIEILSKSNHPAPQSS